MKKAVIMAFCLVFTSTAFAAERGSEEYKKISEYKKAQRAAKANPAASVSKEKGFWEKEGERSGLGGSGSRVGTFIGSLNPVPFLKDQNEKYKTRKTGMMHTTPAAVK